MEKVALLKVSQIWGWQEGSVEGGTAQLMYVLDPAAPQAPAGHPRAPRYFCRESDHVLVNKLNFERSF